GPGDFSLSPNPAGNSVILAIRGEQHLYYKAETFAGDPAPSLSFAVSQGDSITFEYLSRDGSGESLALWTPRVSITDAAQHTQTYPPYISVALPPNPIPFPPGTSRDSKSAVEAFSGGYHGWRYGVWNGKDPFDPDKLYTLLLESLTQQILHDAI